VAEHTESYNYDGNP